MAKDDLYFRLRLPEDLKKRVQQAAESSHRSMTTEIIARLEASFQQAGTGDVKDMLSKVFEQQVRIVETMERAGLKLSPEDRASIIPSPEMLGRKKR